MVVSRARFTCPQCRQTFQASTPRVTRAARDLHVRRVHRSCAKVARRLARETARRAALRALRRARVAAAPAAAARG
eukprot:13414222-Alexandrium_andersonii.AAC.1